MSDLIECWRCESTIGLSDVSEADGLCPRCDAEIDLDGYRLAAIDQLRAERDQLKAELAALRATHPAPASVGGAQVVGRVHHNSEHAEPVRAVLNSIGRQLPDDAPLYANPATTVPAADIVHQCIAEELASWTGDYRGPVGRALHDLQQRIHRAMQEALSAKP